MELSENFRKKIEISFEAQVCENQTKNVMAKNLKSVLENLQ